MSAITTRKPRETLAVLDGMNRVPAGEFAMGSQDFYR